MTNSGSVSSQKLGSATIFGGAAIALMGGGTVTNAATGHLSARWIGVQIGTRTAAVGGTLINQGSIYAGDGRNGAGVWVHGPALISNAAGGTIASINLGVVAYYTTTLINAGFIGGVVSFDAVQAGYADRVVAMPGAIFAGAVSGGNVIGSAVVSTLELGSGASAGTFTGIGTQFVEFGQVTVDAGARWTLTGANTIVSGATFTDSGTVTNAGSETGGITLDGGVVTNVSGATISSSFAAVYGAAGSAGGTVVNAGVLAGPASGVGAGVALLSGGTVTNTAGGLIVASEGVYISGTSTAANTGTVVNAGTIAGYEHQGVELGDGGVVSNASGAAIVGADNGLTVQFQNAASQSAVVFNQGLIAGTAGYGVALRSNGNNVLTNASGGTIVGGQGGLFVAAGGTAVNAGSIGVNGGGSIAAAFGAGAADLLVLVPGAVFSGTVTGGNTIGAAFASTLELASGASAGTLSGLGAQFVDFAQVTVDAGASWVFAGGNTVQSGATLAVAGTLTNRGSLMGPVTLALGGTLMNSAAGSIDSTAAYSVSGSGGPSTVVNAGTIGNGGSSGLVGAIGIGGGLVLNQVGGTISAYGFGVSFVGATGGSVNNAGIIAAHKFPAFYASGAPATVTNAGLLSSDLGTAIVLEKGGSVTNQATGTIAGADGIFLDQTASTVVNAGTIAASGNFGLQFGAAGTLINSGAVSAASYAVLFNAGVRNLLVIDPGASFGGQVVGGNAVTSPIVSTLELAAGTFAGTLSGLGSQYIQFGRVTVDAGASWTFTGTNSILTGATLTDSGTLANTGTIGGAVLLAGGTVVNATGATIVGSPGAVFGVSGGAAGTVLNAGVLIGGTNPTYSAGVALLSGGFVSNAFGGSIAATGVGIYVGGAGTIINAGIVGGTGTHGNGVEIAGGGLVSNAAGGTIAAAVQGVGMDHGGSVSNQGLIQSGVNGYNGVYFARGGALTNSGTILGGQKGVLFNNNSGATVGTVTNSGTILGLSAFSEGVVLTAGGAVTNNAGGTIDGTFAGVSLTAGGTVTNAGGGTITGGYIGIYAGGAAATVANAGFIAGSMNAAIDLSQGGLVTNQGSGVIAGYGLFARGVGIYDATGTVINAGTIVSAGQYAVYVDNGGSVVNQIGGVIAGYSDGVVMRNASGTVTNSGLISSSAANAVYVFDGQVTNLTQGTIVGAGAGVVIAIDGVLVNAGTITGNGSTYAGVTLRSGGTIVNQGGGTIAGTTAAVQFAAGFTNRLVIGPGAVFNGIVNAGNSIGGSFVSTMELASGASAGTLSSFGSKYIGFGVVTVDAGASWVLPSAGSISPGVAITDSGTLTNLGSLASAVTLVSGSELINSGGMSASVVMRGGTFVNAAGATVAAAPAAVYGLSNVSAATVLNAGVLTGGTGLTRSGGVVLLSGGFVSNAASGTITGTDGVYVTAASSSVVNLGVIAGTSHGIQLRSGGTVTNAGTISGPGAAVQEYAGTANRVIFDPGATFIGLVDGGNAIGSSIVSTLELASGATAGTLSGFGTQFVDFAAITIDSGAVWVLGGNDTFGSGVTLTNNGVLKVGGTFTNASTLAGPISIASGGIFTNASGGTIVGSGLAAVVGTSGGAGSVFNAGVIDPATYGIYLPAGGLITNTPTALIEGTAAGVKIAGGVGTIANSGTILGLSAGGYGIVLAAGGTIFNSAGGTISGAGIGIDVTHGGTVVNAGSLIGGTDAVTFAAGYTNRLVLVPGAFRSGIADGGNTIGATSVSTLELTSAAGNGTLGGFGSQFINFAQVTIDAGASWVVGGTDSIAAGVTLTNSGTFFDNNTLINKGFIDSTAGTVLVGSSAGLNGTLIVNAGGTFNAGVTGTAVDLLIGVGTAASTLAAATGTVLVTGAGAVLHSYGAIVVSKATGSAGLLEFANGATGQAATSNETIQAAVGIGSGGPGTLLVTDPGSTFTVKGQLFLGRAGTGALTVANQGTLVLQNDLSGGTANWQIGVGSGAVAGQQGGSGYAVITGGGLVNAGTTNSLVQIGGNGDTGTLTVNAGSMQAGFFKLGGATTIAGTVYAGSGVLNVGTGGLVGAFGTTSASIVLGQGQGGSGTVTVNGGTLYSAGNVLIGNQTSASGIISIGTLGTLIAGGLNEASAGGSTGTVIVNGGSLKDNGFFNVGQGGTGFVTVEAGGTVQLTRSGGAVADVGGSPSGQGTVVVTGANSLLLDNGQFIVGDQGTGSLDVNSGALVNAGANQFNIANQNGGTGFVSVESGGTLLAGALAVDTPISGTATGVLMIGAGGSVGVTSVAVGGGGTIAVGGASAAVLSDTGNFIVGQSGSVAGTLSVGQGGTVTFGSGGGQLSIGANDGSNGTVTVNGGTLSGAGVNISAPASGTSTALMSVGAGGVVSVSSLNGGQAAR